MIISEQGTNNDECLSGAAGPGMGTAMHAAFVFDNPKMYACKTSIQIVQKDLLDL